MVRIKNRFEYTESRIVLFIRAKAITNNKPQKVSKNTDNRFILLFILSTKSLNGHVIAIDGGQSLQKLPRDVAFLNTPSQ